MKTENQKIDLYLLNALFAGHYIDWRKERSSNLSYFAEYLRKIKKSERASFGKLLDQLTILDIDEIIYNKDFNFTNDEYYFKFNDEEFFEYSIVENMKVDNFNNGILKYKTTNSNYRIICNEHFNKKIILLNTLEIDPSSLPLSANKLFIVTDLVTQEEVLKDKNLLLAVKNCLKKEQENLNKRENISSSEILKYI